MAGIIYKGRGYTLTWPDVWENLYLERVPKHGKFGNFSKWLIGHNTPDCVVEFLAEFGIGKGDEISSQQVATLLLNGGFAKYLVDQEPQLALKLRVGKEVEL